VAVNGVSLTIAALEGARLETELIPLTLKGTNLGDLRGGDPVNLECDMVGKYAYNWFSQGRSRR
jgi:riboflavin synthase